MSCIRRVLLNIVFVWIFMMDSSSAVALDSGACFVNINGDSQIGLAKAVAARDTLGLEVFSMELDAVTVTAKSRRDYKRLKKREKQNFIAEFKQKLREDFPGVRSEYNVLSGYRLLQDTVVMASGNMTGTFVELPKAKKNGGDSLAVVDAQYMEYVNAALKRNIEQMERKEQQAREKRDSVLAAQALTAMQKSDALANASNSAMQKPDMVINADDSATQESNTENGANVISFGKKNVQEEIHKMLWGVSPVVVLDQLEEMKGKWDYIPNGDGTSYVVFRGHRGFLGIVRIEWAVNYLVDSRTLSVVKITENLDAKLSIPFGVSIKGEDLESLNMLNVAYGSFDSFKFRKGMVSIKRYVEYEENGGGKISGSKEMPSRKPEQKVLDFDLRVIGKQDKEIHMKAAAKASVLE